MKSFLISIAIAVSLLPVLVHTARADSMPKALKDCLAQGSDEFRPADAIRTFRGEHYGLEYSLEIPSNFRAMRGANGQISVVSPAEFDRITCTLAAGYGAGGDDLVNVSFRELPEESVYAADRTKGTLNLTPTEEGQYWVTEDSYNHMAESDYRSRVIFIDALPGSFEPSRVVVVYGAAQDAYAARARSSFRIEAKK